MLLLNYCPPLVKPCSYSIEHTASFCFDRLYYRQSVTKSIQAFLAPEGHYLVGLSFKFPGKLPNLKGIEETKTHKGILSPQKLKKYLKRGGGVIFF